MSSIEDMQKKRCSFCDRPHHPNKKMIQGQSAIICEDCILFCHNFLHGGNMKVHNEFTRKIIDPPKPQEIKQHLDAFVIGQDHAKKVLSVAAYNHYKRIFHNNKRHKKSHYNKKIDHDIVLEKSNILLVGPTGVGKTLLARTLADFLHVPFAITDATSLTEAGYVGEDVEYMLLKLYQAANEDIETAQQGIIFIDEIDKVSRKSKNPSITRDVSGEGVQQALLKIIEGTIASVPPQGGRKHPHQKMLKIDTSNILFICGGAFVGLEDIVMTRVNENSVGFGAGENKKFRENRSSYDIVSKHMHPEDFIHYGFVPELIGRLPIMTALKDHTVESLRRVLVEPKNSIIKQAAKFFELNDVELVFNEDALDLVASMAFEQKIGARGLRSIIEDILLESMYTIPSQPDVKKIRVTKKTILSKTLPLLEYNSVVEDSA